MTKLDWLVEQLKKYDKDNPDPNCWEWPWTRTPSGYGQVWFDNHLARVNRVVAHLCFGFDLEDRRHCVMHKCDNPPCWNPSHLKPGTWSENMSDSWENKIRPEFCPKGHELTKENSRIGSPSSGTWRACRICYKEKRRLYMRKYRASSR